MNIDFFERMWPHVEGRLHLWKNIIENPQRAIRNRLSTADDIFIDSTSFLFTTTIATLAILIPIDFVALGASSKSFPIWVTLFILYMMNPVIFGTYAYLVARTLGSSLLFKDCMYAMFYLSGLLLPLYASQYVTRPVMANRALMGAWREDPAFVIQNPDIFWSASVFAVVLFEIMIIAFIVYKAIPVMAWLLKSGRVKATIAFLVSGILYAMTSSLIYSPFLREIYPTS